MNSRNAEKMRIMTWNVRGLNCPMKIRKIGRYAERQNIDVLMLQETHLLKDTHDKMLPRWSGPRGGAAYSKYARGVLILTRKHLPFRLHATRADAGGRWVLLAGEINGTNILFCNSYAPNVDDPEYVSTLLAQCMGFPDHHWCIGGDFNTTFDDTMDRSKGTNKATPKAARCWLEQMSMYDMVDAWRLWHPGVKGYTHYTTVHDLHTRIDGYLMDSRLYGCVSDVAIYPRTWSDHSPVMLECKLRNVLGNTYIWRNKPRAYNDLVYRTEMEKTLKDYFEHNEGSVQSGATLWEACKCVMRGRAMSLEGSILKTIRKELETLENKLDELTLRLTNSDSSQDRILYTKLLLDYDAVAKRELDYLYKEQNARRYSEGSRPGRYLARLVRQYTSPPTITQINDKHGNVLKDTTSILEEFKTYYEDVYRNETNILEEDAADYLNDIRLAWASDIDRKLLNDPITSEEIVTAIKGLQIGKAPGPDGLGAEFYKAHCNFLAPYLRDIYIEAFEIGELPDTTRDALIVSLLKPGKTPENLDSYRPLSMLNTDMKILTKVIANRLMYIMPFLTLPDQAGFVHGRATTDNLRLLFAISDTVQDTQDTVVASLDFQKAFDTVNWTYLLATLTSMGLGSRFIKMVKTVYTKPKARVLINSVCSDYFYIEKGVRQGCPLSPLLFALAVEPFACKLRQRHTTMGIVLPEARVTVSLYADDILVYIQDPSIHVPQLLNEIENFSLVTGICINWKKSLLIPLNDTSWHPDAHCPLIWETTCFKYLGIYYARDKKQLYIRNYVRLLEEVGALAERWKNVPIDLAGRIGLVKMIILPKCLYVFLNTPVIPPAIFFTILRTHTLQIIWAGKQARISYDVLVQPMAEGGLALPDLERYYDSAQSFFIARWFNTSITRPHKWAEKALIVEKDLREQALKDNATVRPYSGDVVNCSKNALRKMKKWVTTPLQVAGDVEIRWVPQLSLNNEPRWIKYLDRAGLKKVKDLFVDDWFKAQYEVEQHAAFKGCDFFMYMRVKESCKKWLSDYPFLPPDDPVVKLVCLDTENGVRVSEIYAATTRPISTYWEKLKGKWEVDVEESITEEEWVLAKKQIKEIASNYRYKLIQFKVLHRMYYSPSKLALYYKDRDPKCPKCLCDEATFYHLLWVCPKVQNFWFDVVSETGKILECELKLDPKVWLLGINIDMTGLKKRLFNMIAMAAKKTIAEKWMSKNVPTLKHLNNMLWKHYETETTYWNMITPTCAPKDFWAPILNYWFLQNLTQDIEQ